MLAPELAAASGKGLARQWATFACSSCHQVTLAKGLAFLANMQGSSIGGPRDTVDELYPSVQSVDDALPGSAKTFLEQATATLHAPDAAAVMAASSVDSMLKAKGFTEGSLYKRIDSAVKDHVLTEAMGSWAHAVRLEANSVRHADEERPHLTAEEAKRVVDFAWALGDFLFVLTARVEAGIEATKDAATGSLTSPAPMG